MGRKRGFQWVREDQDTEALERVQRKSHSEVRADDAAIEALAEALLGRTVRAREALELPAVLMKALAEHGRLKGSARNRNMRRLKGLIRGMDDVDALREALDEETPAEKRARELERWRTRILTEGDPAVQAFIDQHPGADRAGIRALARAGGQPDEAAALKAQKKLFQVLKASQPIE